MIVNEMSLYALWWFEYWDSYCGCLALELDIEILTIVTV